MSMMHLESRLMAVLGYIDANNAVNSFPVVVEVDHDELMKLQR